MTNLTPVCEIWKLYCDVQPLFLFTETFLDPVETGDELRKEVTALRIDYRINHLKEQHIDKNGWLRDARTLHLNELEHVLREPLVWLETIVDDQLEREGLKDLSKLETLADFTKLVALRTILQNHVNANPPTSTRTSRPSTGTEPSWRRKYSDQLVENVADYISF